MWHCWFILQFLLIRPQIIDHRLTDVDEITKPMSTLNPTYSKESEEKKKDKTSDV